MKAISATAFLTLSLELVNNYTNVLCDICTLILFDAFHRQLHYGRYLKLKSI